MTPALRRTLQVSTWLLALALVLAPVVAVLNGWIGSERWALRTLRVNDGLAHVDRARLVEAIAPHANAGFFAVRLDQVQAAVEQLPWVDRAEVRKHWPDVLEVRIHEHQPFARWGDDRLLSVQGKLFPADGIEPPPELPLLHGPDARSADVVALYNQARELFAGSGTAVRSVDLDTRGSWSLQLGNGATVIVGSHEARLRLRRFARIMPQLTLGRLNPLLRADLRYTNGFALVWGDVPAQSPAAEGAATGAPASQPAAATSGAAATASTSFLLVPGTQA